MINKTCTISVMEDVFTYLMFGRQLEQFKLFGNKRLHDGIFQNIEEF